MKLLTFLWNRLLALVSSIILIAVLLLLFVGIRLTSISQSDAEEHVRGKRDYLAQIADASVPQDTPNIVFILYDDMGYGDIGAGANGRDLIATPNLDRLAREGVTLSDFHSPAAVCTPSRAAYLTGRLAPRAGLPHVVFPTGSSTALTIKALFNPGGNTRLPAEEITLADLLRAAGYATGMVGKWHLGDRSPSLPNDMGFDSYFGALYSNDMEPFAFYRDREIAVPAPVDQTQMTALYTDAAVDFIEQSAQSNFFLYFAHNFPHDPLHASADRRGRSRAGLYGDVLEEIDESVGEIIAALQRAGALDNTLIIVTSDNGPWFLGDAGNLRGRKGNTFEGGMRVPFIAHWPPRIDSLGVVDSMAMGTDLFPTVLDILGLPAPRDRIIDGRSILEVLTGGAETPHDYLYYYDSETLFAVRDQRFKYRAPAGVFYSTDAMPMAAAVPQKEWLFDLANDPREAYDTSLKYPAELARLKAALAQRNSEMAENKRGWRTR